MSVDTNRRVLEASLHFWFSARHELVESQLLRDPLASAINKLSAEDAGRLAETAVRVYSYEKQTGRNIVEDYKGAADWNLSPEQSALLKATEILARVMDAAGGVRGIMPRQHKTAEMHMAFANTGLATLSAACTPRGM